MSDNRSFVWPWPWSAFAPQQLSQPINTGWTFGNLVQVTNANSSAPDVERDVVSHHSYGRQIGRLMDAVVALSEDVPGASKDPRVKALREIATKVEKIKREAEKNRANELLSELRALKHADPKGWQALIKSVEA
jgi:hypothetical protein